MHMVTTQLIFKLFISNLGQRVGEHIWESAFIHWGYFLNWVCFHVGQEGLI